MQKTALLAGATGLIGAALLPLLLADARYAKVVVVGRRPVALAHPKLVQVVTELDDLESHRLQLIADDVYCCLGTTRQQAGSKEAFYKVDFLYVVQLAALAASNFAAQFLVVSSIGADAGSRVYYSRVKGEMEAAVGPCPSGRCIFSGRRCCWASAPTRAWASESGPRPWPWRGPCCAAAGPSTGPWRPLPWPPPCCAPPTPTLPASACTSPPGPSGGAPGPHVFQQKTPAIATGVFFYSVINNVDS